MKIMKYASGKHTLRLSKADARRLFKKAGWTDDLSYLEDDEEDWTDLDMSDIDIEDVISDMEDEELKHQLLDLPQDEGDDPNYTAKCEEALSMLSPILEDLAGGQWIDPESLVNELVDAVGPLTESDVDTLHPLEVVRTFLAQPVRSEDEELKTGIRLIMEKAGIPEEEPEEAVPEPAPRRASSKSPLGFSQSSDMWYKILKDK